MARMINLPYQSEIDDSRFATEAEADAYDHALRTASVLDPFVDEHYTQKMSKDSFRKILATNLGTLAGLYESTRNKRPRRSKEQKKRDDIAELEKRIGKETDVAKVKTLQEEKDKIEADLAEYLASKATESKASKSKTKK